MGSLSSRRHPRRRRMWLCLDYYSLQKEPRFADGHRLLDGRCLRVSGDLSTLSGSRICRTVAIRKCSKTKRLGEYVKLATTPRIGCGEIHSVP